MRWQSVCMRYVVIFCFSLSGMVSNIAEGADFNDTLVHYYLTSGQNLEIELSHTHFVLKSIYQDSASKDSIIEPGSAMARFDYLLPRKNQRANLMFGVVGLTSALYSYDDLMVQGFGGFTYLGVSSGSGDDVTTLAGFYNVMLGGELAYQDFVNVRGSASVTGMVRGQSETLWDFDQANITISSPLTGLFGKGRVDIARGKPRDIVTGMNLDFSESGWGLLRLAYTHRFAYEITGAVIKNDGDMIQDLPADIGGLVAWDYVSPWDGSSYFGLQASLASVPSIVRYAIGEVGFGEFRGRTKSSFFARGGIAYDRLGDKIVAGVAGGGRITDKELGALFEITVGRNEPSFVDRLGEAGQLAVAFNLSFILDGTD